MAHGSVKDEFGAFPFLDSGRLEFQAVPARPDIGKASCPSGFQAGPVFEILCDGHHLGVVLRVEGPIDRPVMRNGNVFPGTVVDVYSGEFPIRLDELPSFVQKVFLAKTLVVRRTGQDDKGG